MFAGIGGFRAGLERAGGFQCVGHCDIDKYADASCRAIHDIREEERYYPDARKIAPNDLPDFDLLCGGFPCQAFSLAGRRRGQPQLFHQAGVAHRPRFAVHPGGDAVAAQFLHARYPGGVQRFAKGFF